MRVVILTAYTKSLLWFRMDLIDSLVVAGHDVQAWGPDSVEGCGELFAAHGATYRSYSVARNSISVLGDLQTYRELLRMFREVRPDRVFLYQAKPIAYGCPAANRAGVRGIYPLVAGLGSVFRSEGVFNRIVRRILAFQYRNAFRMSERVFIQNRDDLQVLASLDVLPVEKAVMLNGSGVNIEHFAQEPLPDSAVFIFIGRLIRDKGVVEYLQACDEIVRRHPGVECLLVGPYDTNPSALHSHDLEPLLGAPGVEYLGEHTDVRPLLARASVFVLPSYHEGTPKSALEAMAMGRPVITTDAPGCREVVEDGVNGRLVPPRDVEALISRMEEFISSPEMIPRMGREARRIAEDKYDVRKVNQVILSTMGLDTASNRDMSVR